MRNKQASEGKSTSAPPANAQTEVVRSRATNGALRIAKASVTPAATKTATAASPASKVSPECDAPRLSVHDACHGCESRSLSRAHDLMFLG